MAAVVVWALVVPSALAYATVAGVPVQYGLYAIPLAAVAYAVFTQSRHVYTGPSSTVAAVSAASIATLATAGSPAYITLTVFLAVFVGVFLVVMGVLRMGFLAKYLAKPVLDGFVVGLVIFISIDQLPKIFGVPKAEGNAIQVLFGILADFQLWNYLTMAVGFASVAALFLLAKYVPRAPSALLVTSVAILLADLFNLSARGVTVVGPIPTGLPSYDLAPVSAEQLLGLIPAAFAVLIVGFAESVAIAKSYGSRFGYRIDPSQEMIAQGAANLGSAGMTGFAVDASLSKTAANVAAGGKTPMVLLVVAVLGLFTLTFLAGIFTDLPQATLGAIVIFALFHSIGFHPLARYRKARLPDFWPALGAIVGVLVFGILGGLVIGVILSLIILMLRIDRPHFAILGRNETGAIYGDLEVPGFTPVPGVLIYRFDAPLIFFNADRFEEQVRKNFERTQPRPHAVVIDFEVIGQTDTTATETLRELKKWLEARGAVLVLARVTRKVLDFLRRDGALEAIGEDKVYPTVQSAVEAYERP